MQLVREREDWMAQIDWAFIGSLEGEAIPKGYVPSDSSGVTVATGVDLGQRAMPELVAPGLAAALTGSSPISPSNAARGKLASARSTSAPPVHAARRGAPARPARCQFSRQPHRSTPER